MNELETLRQELAELRHEVRALRRTRWITPGALGVTLVAMVALGVAAPKQDGQTPPADHRPLQRAQDLVCKSIKIVDDNDHPRVQLGSDKDGGLIVIYGSDNKERFYAAVEHNAGFTDWFDAEGKRRATVFIGDQGGELRLNDRFDHPGVSLRQGEKGGSLKLTGADGSDRVALGGDNGGFLDLFDAFGSMRASMYVNAENSAQFKLLSPDKVARLLLSGDAPGGKVTAYDADGKTKATFPPVVSP